MNEPAKLKAGARLRRIENGAEVTYVVVAVGERNITVRPVAVDGYAALGLDRIVTRLQTI